MNKKNLLIGEYFINLQACNSFSTKMYIIFKFKRFSIAVVYLLLDWYIDSSKLYIHVCVCVHEEQSNYK